jgi:hypothetical protein
MGKALIVGGDQIDGIKQVLTSYGMAGITHWSGRKVGDSNKVIPQDIKLIVLVTDWISHSLTKKIKLNAARRGVRVVFTPNGSATLRTRLDRISHDTVTEADCRKIMEIAARPVTHLLQWIKVSAAILFLEAPLSERSLDPAQAVSRLRLLSVLT